LLKPDTPARFSLGSAIYFPLLVLEFNRRRINIPAANAVRVNCSKVVVLVDDFTPAAT